MTAPARPLRPVRIANASGFFGDRHGALREMVEGGPVDFVTGDYLAELTMMILGKQRAKNPKAGFASTFPGQLEPVLKTILERGIKVVVNAGGLHPAGLAEVVRALGEKLGVAPRVATVHGDDLKPTLAELVAAGHGLRNLETGAALPDDLSPVLTANAYLGAWGIVRALTAGADIVLCPRVTDASLVVGAAAYWHGWKRDDWDALAGAVVAGHVIECGPQATGGNYSGFRTLKNLAHPGFPLAEVAADGSSVITKHPGTGGAVTVGTVTAQLVYEVSTTRYLNPDVTTLLDTITIAAASDGPDRVALTGVKGAPPPATTKVAMTLRGMYRNEMTFAVVGLDIDEKIALLETNLRAELSKRDLTLHFVRIGSALPDAARQDDATVLLRVVATSHDEAMVSRAFSSAVVEQGLSSYPGLFGLTPPGGATEVGAYWPALVEQSALRHSVSLPDGTEEVIALPPVMEPPPPPAPETLPAAPSDLGPTRRVPLGAVVDARSGDKGSDANVGLWVRAAGEADVDADAAADAAYAWLCRELTVDRLRQLVPEAGALPIERHALPRLRALNFVLRGFLEGGAAASLRVDKQGKALGEHLRARLVDVPEALLDRS